MSLPLGTAPRTDEADQPGEGSAASTRERILDAAEVCFADQGFAGAGMREIAASVALNPASLYNHFPGKQALYEAVLERGLRPILELIDALAHTDWTPESLDEEADRLVKRLAQRPHLSRLIMHEALRGGESLNRLSSEWLRPLYTRALATFQQTRGVEGRWDEEELPLLLTAFHHLILGYFATAPMLREMFGEDPLSEDHVERQSRFVRKVVRRLVSGASPPRPGER